MASWIAHLRVAESVDACFPQASFDQFLVGNVAPDSGVLNPDRKTYTPSDEVSHYRNPTRAKWSREDMRFFSEQLAAGPVDASPAACFLLGYYCHLFLDNLWSHYVYRPTAAAYRERFRADPGFVWTVKRDWYALDAMYLRAHPDWRVWSAFRSAACACDCLPMYRPKTITDNVARIRRRFEEAGDPPALQGYLTMEQIDAFVDLSSRLCNEAIALIREDHADGAGSTLDLLAARHAFLRADSGDPSVDLAVLERLS